MLLLQLLLLIMLQDLQFKPIRHMLLKWGVQLRESLRWLCSHLRRENKRQSASLGLIRLGKVVMLGLSSTLNLLQACLITMDRPLWIIIIKINQTEWNEDSLVVKDVLFGRQASYLDSLLNWRRHSMLTSFILSSITLYHLMLMLMAMCVLLFLLMAISWIRLPSPCILLLSSSLTLLLLISTWWPSLRLKLFLLTTLRWQTMQVCLDSLLLLNLACFRTWIICLLIVSLRQT